MSALGDGADRPVKVLGFSHDHPRVAAAETAVRAACGARVSATRSQPHYVDVTHPDANKGTAVAYLCRTLGIAPDEVATIGDGQNDTLMFARSGTSIAMGNADDDVMSAAGAVTTANDDDGFAAAMHRYVLTT
jgi:hydroxymethylpyrimidine pyrophosphatase-like HAD family hydrolase